MGKKAISCAILLVFCVFTLNKAYAQHFPAVMGAVLETGSGLLESDNYGTGIARITPFAGLWINGIGFARIGISTSEKKETNSDGSSMEAKRFDLSMQIGFSAIGPERPYIAASYVRNKAYSNEADLTWSEWGLGIGHRFSLSPFAAIVIEAEHRWITKHYDRLQNGSI